MFFIVYPEPAVSSGHWPDERGGWCEGGWGHRPDRTGEEWTC